MFPLKKLYEKSAIFNWDDRQKPVGFPLEAYLIQFIKQQYYETRPQNLHLRYFLTKLQHSNRNLTPLQGYKIKL